MHYPRLFLALNVTLCKGIILYHVLCYFSILNRLFGTNVCGAKGWHWSRNNWNALNHFKEWNKAVAWKVDLKERTTSEQPGNEMMKSTLAKVHQLCQTTKNKTGVRLVSKLLLSIKHSVSFLREREVTARSQSAIKYCGNESLKWRKRLSGYTLECWG